MKLFDFKKYKIIQNKIGDLTADYTHYFTEGQWSSYELLLYILSITGKAKVILTSYSISDITIRTIKKAIEADYISSIDLLLNYSVKRNKVDLLYFSSNVINKIALNNNHSKIMIIENDNYKIIVNQSANATVNYSDESGIVCTKHDIYHVYKENIEKLFNEKTIIKKNEFIRRTACRH